MVLTSRRYHSKVLLAVVLASFLAYFTLYYDRLGFSIVLSHYCSEHDVSQTMKGVVLAAFYAGYSFTQLFVGYILGKYENYYKLILFSFVACSSINSLILPFLFTRLYSVEALETTNNLLFLLTLSQFISGVFSSIYIPSIYKCLHTWLPSPIDKDRYLPIIQSGMYLGISISIVLNTNIIHDNELRSYYHIFNGIIYFTCIMIWILLHVRSKHYHKVEMISNSDLEANNQNNSHLHVFHSNIRHRHLRNENVQNDSSVERIATLSPLYSKTTPKSIYQKCSSSINVSIYMILYNYILFTFIYWLPMYQSFNQSIVPLYYGYYHSSFSYLCIFISSISTNTIHEWLSIKTNSTKSKLSITALMDVIGYSMISISLIYLSTSSSELYSTASSACALFGLGLCSNAKGDMLSSNSINTLIGSLLGILMNSVIIDFSNGLFLYTGWMYILILLLASCTTNIYKSMKAIRKVDTRPESLIN